jgi:hypothetical protein
MPLTRPIPVLQPATPAAGGNQGKMHASTTPHPTNSRPGPATRVLARLRVSSGSASLVPNLGTFSRTVVRHFAAWAGKGTGEALRRSCLLPRPWLPCLLARAYSQKRQVVRPRV